MQRIKGMLKNAFLVVLATLISAEVLSVASVELGLINAPRPSYELPSFQPFRGDINADFGLWRHPNSQLSHVTTCFNVTYKSNSYGARDIERPREADGPRTIVLGDSMVGGIGVNREERFTEKLEARTSIPHLNFGIVNTGPTQYQLIYRHLAKSFSHDRLVVVVLPNNDFRDDDYDFGQRALADRYRPYYVKGQDGEWELVYFNKDQLGLGGNSEQARHKQQRRAARQFLTNFSYAKNVWNYMKGLFDNSALNIADMNAVFRPIDETRPPSGFYDYKPQELERMTYVLDLLDQDSGSRPMTVVLIPMRFDITRYKADGEPPLVRDMRAFAAARPDVEVVDLLSEFAKLDDPASYYLPCDGHWNGKGTDVVAERLARAIYGR